MNRFDEIIKDRLSKMEMPYDESAWAAVEAGLDPIATTPSDGGAQSFSTSLISGIAATALIGLVIVGAPLLSEDESLSEMTSIEQSGVMENPVVSADEATNETVAFVEHVEQTTHEIALEPAAEKTQEPAHKSEAVIADESNDVTPKQEINGAVKLDKNSAAKPSLKIDFKAIGIQCSGNDITFEALSNETSKTTEVSWLIDDVHVRNGKTIQYSFDEPGKHSVTLMVTGDNGTKTSIQKMVEIYDIPNPSIISEVEHNDVCFLQKMTLSADPSAHSYTWTYDGSTTKGSEFSAHLEGGEHSIGVRSVNEAGCSNELKHTVSVEPGLVLFFPNAFTPNGDGNNDTWAPSGLDNCAGVQIQIYRALDNQLIFESNNLDGWNGAVQGSSEKAQPGEQYLYRVIALDGCDHKKVFTGNLTVTR